LEKFQGVISEDRLFVAMAMALKVQGHRETAHMGGIDLDVNIKCGDGDVQPLWAYEWLLILEMDQDCAGHYFKLNKSCGCL